MNITMIQDRVLISEAKPKVKSDGGIYLPPKDKVEDDRLVCSKSGEGWVANIGPQVRDLEVGMKVFFGSFVGMDVELDGEKYLMMNEEDVQAIMEGV